MNAKKLSAYDEGLREVCERYFAGEVGTSFKSHHLEKHLPLPHPLSKVAPRFAAGEGAGPRLSQEDMVGDGCVGDACTTSPLNGLLAGFRVTLPTCGPRCNRLERSWTWATSGVGLVVGTPRV